ncbi:MAG: mechanosensitive ion channel, partial [Candidatus Subteraquimicrobiales bacterium]|nr:mechanosensitive ion channel [Candidatus Subteraquimicrobiales bacterium]
MKEAIEILRQTFAVDEIILKGSRILLIITFSFVFYWLGPFIFSRFKPRLAEKEKTQEIKKAKRVLTLVALFKDIYRYVLFFLCGFMILREIGIDAAPLLATAGVVGLAIGFGAQSLVKDMISGFFILFEDQYSVSDFVYLKAGPFEAIGLVEEFGLRMTKIRDINGNLHFVPNG